MDSSTDRPGSQAQETTVGAGGNGRATRPSDTDVRSEPPEATSILLVSDDAVEAGITCVRLEAAGFGAATVVSDLAAAIEAVSRARFDCVLLDPVLPDVAGLEAVETLAGVYEGPIVVLADVEDREMGVEVIRHGAQDYLGKGNVTTSVLERVIRYSMERWEDRRRMAQLVREKDRFLAVISHELRTPLTPLVGFAKVLAEGAWVDEEERSELLSVLTEQAAQLQAIIDDLLVAARTDIGGIHLAMEDVDLAPIAERAARAFGENEQLRVERRNGSVRVWGDEVRIVQVVRNLVTNAVRYGGHDRAIIVGSENGRGFIEVSDDGEGVPAGDADRIFHPFESLGQRRKAPGSVGLGLSIARYLSDAMGGSLEYRREADRSVFRMALVSTSRSVPHRVELDASPFAPGPIPRR